MKLEARRPLMSKLSPMSSSTDGIHPYFRTQFVQRFINRGNSVGPDANLPLEIKPRGDAQEGSQRPL